VLAQASRCVLVVAAALAASAALASGVAAKPKGFEFGVTAGEVTADSALLWAKARHGGMVLAQIVDRGGFGRCKGANAAKKVKAEASHDNTVTARVHKLEADTSYKYRFCTPGGRRSAKGHFTTAPDPRSKQTIRFGFSGDQDARPVPGGTEPYWNDFQIWDAIRQQRNDFNVLMGDTIYSDTEVPGYTLADVALTKQQKWKAYKINLGMRPWTKTRGAAAYYAHWDDHEFINNFARGENNFPLGVGTVNTDGEQLYKASRKAFTDYNPVSYSDRNGLYRSVQWGKNLEIFFLDERSFRNNLVDYTGVCDNPPGSGDRDLAPTAPQSTRDLFSVIVPQLANPVPPGCLEAINDPNRNMLVYLKLLIFKSEIK
jgi:alkaline phosphatase D